MECEDKRKYRIELYKHIIAQHMQEIAIKAGKLPDDQRDVFRRLYRKRQRAWRWCQDQLSEVEV